MGIIKDLTGQVFGELTVLRHVGITKDRRALWESRCSCGKIKVCPSKLLIDGHTKSCGCKTSEWLANGKRTHGYASRTGAAPEYTAYMAMKTRCLNPNSTRFDYWGGRGVKICQRWLDSFENFLEDMGPKPSPFHTLDRLDSSKDYEPGNCQWLEKDNHARKSLKDQHERQRRYIVYNGERRTTKDWAERQGLTISTLDQRVRAGWDVHRMLTTPRQERKKKNE